MTKKLGKNRLNSLTQYFIKMSLERDLTNQPNAETSGNMKESERGALMSPINVQEALVETREESCKSLLDQIIFRFSSLEEMVDCCTKILNERNQQLAELQCEIVHSKYLAITIARKLIAKNSSRKAEKNDLLLKMFNVRSKLDLPQLKIAHPSQQLPAQSSKRDTKDTTSIIRSKSLDEKNRPRVTPSSIPITL